MTISMDQIRAELKRRVTGSTEPQFVHNSERHQVETLAVEQIEEVKRQISQTENLSMSEAVYKLVHNSDKFINARRSEWPAGHYIIYRTVTDSDGCYAEMPFYVTEHHFVSYSPDIDDIIKDDWCVQPE